MKIWQIKDRPKALMLSDEELIMAIQNGLLTKDDVLLNLDLKEEVRLGDSIYSFYLKEVSNEQN